MLERLRAMLVKEFTQILRDPKMRFVIFAVPLVQILLFGYAVNTDVRDVTMAVVDLDNSRQSREFTARLEQSGYFRVVARTDDAASLRRLIDHGEVKAALQFDPGFAARLDAGRSAPLQLIVDGSDANSARVILAYVTGIARRFDAAEQQARLARQGETGPAPGVVLVSRSWFNENLESRDYYLPGVMAQLVLVVTMMLSGMAVVREKEIGTMEQVIVTPIRRWEFILGKTIPFAVIGYIDVTLVTLVAVAWFAIPLRGSLGLLAVATGLYLLSTLGFGLFISTISRTQQQAMLSSFLFIFPAMLLSGFAFPIANMPAAVQYVTYLNPLRYYLVIIRDIFLKGVGLQILWPQLAALALLGGAILTIAVWRFRKSAG